MENNEFVNFVCGKFDEVKELFLQKNKQYATAGDPLANFRTGALLRYHNNTPGNMYEAAKDYLGKHIAQVYNNGALGDKVDESLLDMVWNNLLSNAVKFTPEGGRIRVRMYRQENLAMVTVADSGCGMDRETLRHIFDKFYQGDTSHATQGNGLGLALAKRIVDLLGGTISVQSIPGKGSEFAVTFSME